MSDGLQPVLTFWTNSKPHTVKQTVGVSLQRLSPVPPHKFVPIGATPYLPGPGELVLAMGDEAVARLQALGLVPKNRTTDSLRGKVYRRDATQGAYMVSYAPHTTLIDPSCQWQIEWDVQLIARLARTGSLAPALGDYRWVDDFDALIARIEARHAETGKPVPVSGDLETKGLSPFARGARIIALGFTADEGQADLIYVPHLASDEQARRVVAGVSWLLNSPKVRLRGANFKFDLNWLLTAWGVACTNYSMDTLLVGSLLDENRSNSLKAHVKIYAPDLGGYDDCVAPGTKLLTADLRWVPVENVQAGDELVGFDEHIPGQGCVRKLRVSIAESTKRLTKPGARVTFDTGQVITCSADHGFLATPAGTSTKLKFMRVFQLKPGDKVRVAVCRTEFEDTFEAGWMSGFLDGEGYCSHQDAGMSLGWSQKPGAVWDRAVSFSKARGFAGYFRQKPDATGGGGCLTSKFSTWQAMRMLQMVRPGRLLAKRPYDGKALPPSHQATITSIELLGDIEVVSLQTSTRTFIAEGLASHNSMNKSDFEAMELVPVEKMRGYLGGDVDGTLRVSNVMLRELPKQPSLSRFYTTVLHPGSKVFRRVEQTGIKVNREKYAVLRSDLQREIGGTTAEVMALLPARIKAKHMTDLSLKPSVLADFFFGPMGLNLKPRMMTEKSGKPSTAKAHFEMFEDVPEAAAMCLLLNRRNQAAKALSTYVEGFLTHLQADGRFHPAYFLHNGDNDWGDHEGGASTGRLSATGPAIQTVPKRTLWGKRIRECLEADEGHVILELDYSQGELKLAACIADEPTMLQVYYDGKDLHTKTGAAGAGLEYDDMLALQTTDPDKFELFRFRAKAQNFGLLYGMAGRGFQIYAWQGYRIRLTLEEAEDAVAVFHRTYEGLKVWHRTYKDLAGRYGQVVTPFGRIRHLPMINCPDRQIASKAGRQAVNAVIQAMLSDMLMWAMAEVDRQYPSYLPIASIHDACYYSVPAEDAVSACHRINGVMSSLPMEQVFGWKAQIPFTADAKFGTNLASMKSAYK